MKQDDPRKYNSITEYLLSQGFTLGKEGFEKGGTTIPWEELQKHTPSTFAEKARRRGWIGVPQQEVVQPFDPKYFPFFWGWREV